MELIKKNIGSLRTQVAGQRGQWCIIACYCVKLLWVNVFLCGEMIFERIEL